MPEAKVDVLGVAEGAPRADLTIESPVPAEQVRALMAAWFPGRIGEPLGTLPLRDALTPRPDAAYAGIFGETVVLCGQELVELADLTALVDSAPDAGTLIRLQFDGLMGSIALDVIAPGGVVVRELLVIADEGVVADEGSRLATELPFWADDQSDDLVPVDPVALGDALLLDLFGLSRASAADDRRDVGGQLLAGFTVLPDPALAEPASAAPADQSSESPSAATGSAARPLPIVAPTDGDPLGVGGGSAGRPVAPPDDSPEPAPAGKPNWWQRLLGGG